MIQTEPDLEDLRRAFAAPDPGTPGEDCPAPETLWAAVRGELPPAALRAVVEHTARCAACAEDWRLAVELAPAGSPRPAVQSSRGWRLAAAAVFCAALGGLWTWRETAPPADPAAYRTGSVLTVEVRPQVPEGTALPADAFELRWSAPAGSTYDLEVGTADLRVLAEAHDLAEPRFRVPAAALDGLPSGTEIYWRVTAITEDGRRIDPPAFRVRLR
jgi:anti-sigma factor RsiW